MTTTNPTNPTIAAGSNPPTTAMPQATKGEAPPVTLDQLAREMTMSPRDARMMLRLAAKQTKQYPNLGKDHVARQPWQWARGSKALEEARKALAQPQPK